MKKHTTYDEVLEIFRKVKPLPRQPEELTDQIMDQLPRHTLSQRKGINIGDSSGRWTIFIGFRTVSSIAALFLIVFFAFQQWEMMSKISKLEEEVYNQKYAPVSLGQIESLKASYVRSYLKQQITSKKAGVMMLRDEKEPLTIDGNSLNQLIQEFEKLEEENRQLKATVLHQFIDTLRKYRSNSSKLKSL